MPLLLTLFFSSPEKVYEKFKSELTKETGDSSEGDYMYWNIKQEVPNYIIPSNINIIKIFTYLYNIPSVQFSVCIGDSSEGDYMYWNIKQEVPNYIYFPLTEKGKTFYYYEFQI